MDAEIWHQHAASRSPRRPSVYGLERLGAMGSAELRRHLTVRAAWLDSWFLASPQAERMLAGLTSTVRTNATTAPGSKSIVGISAVNTAGKSTLVRRWALALYRDSLGHRARQPGMPQWRPQPGLSAREIPVVWLNLQAKTGIKDLNYQMLSYFGYPVSGAIRALTTRVAQAVDQHNVKAVVVDDVHLLDMSDRHARDVLDHLKHLTTELGERGATLVMVGADLEDGPILADPQIAGRLRLLTLTPYLINTAGEKAEWQRLLKTAEAELLPLLPGSSAGVFARHAGLIWRRTQGYVGDTARLLAAATHEAGLDGTFALTPDHLRAPMLSSRAHAAELRLSPRQAATS